MRLTPEEREARRRERSRRSFSDDAYRHYDPARSGYGSAADWAAAAEDMAAGRGAFRGATSRSSAEDTRRTRDLQLLGLETAPAHVSGLKSAFRRAAFGAHPDHGGTDAAFREVFAAYERLLDAY